jgi:light-regulated signal transduction histidine kinase (bacteriophytochrome)
VERNCHGMHPAGAPKWKINITNRVWYKDIGFGLVIARQVIEQHNGVLEVASTFGKGSTFIMKIMRKK